MMRDDFVTIAMLGDFGKPRLALVIQSDLFDQHATVTVLLVTSSLIAAPLLRFSVQASPENGLQKLLQVMVNKPMTGRRDKGGPAFGRIEADAMVEAERCLSVAAKFAGAAPARASPAAFE